MVTTVSGTINSFLVPHIDLLVRMGHSVDVAFRVTEEPRPELGRLGCRVFDLGFSRTPVDSANFGAYRKLKTLVETERYDVVHTHTPVASACVRLACRKMSHTFVMYTAHGFHFYKGAPLKNWLLYYPVEWALARCTDELLLINQEDYKLARRSLHSKAVTYVPGVGVDLTRFAQEPMDKGAMRDAIGVPRDAFMILSIGELSHRKNHSTVIRALHELDDPDIHYVIGGVGPLEGDLLRLARERGLEDRVHLLGFRRDIPDLLGASDLFAFPSYQEGLPVALMEAMACGRAVVCSDTRGNGDLVAEGIGGFLVRPDDTKAWSARISQIKASPGLRSRMGAANVAAVVPFSLEPVLDEMREVYSSVARMVEGKS